MVFQIPAELNGPCGIGISYGLDKLTNPADQLIVSGADQNNEEAVRWAVQRTPVEAGMSAKAKSILFNGIMWIVSNRLHTNACARRIDANAQEVTADAEVTNILGQNISKDQVATLIFATKINLFMINHHVGQDPQKVQGYLGKVLAQWELENEAGIRKVLWRLGHFFDTKYAFYLLGLIENAPENYPALIQPNQVEISQETSLRLRSSPSGTAKFAVYFGIAKLAARGIYGSLIPPLDNYAALLALEIDIAARPLHYHPGSSFYTGQAPIESDLISEAAKEDLAAFIHAAYPTSTLAKSPAMISKDNIKANPIFLNITQIRQSLLAKRLTDAELNQFKNLNLGQNLKLQFFPQQNPPQNPNNNPPQVPQPVPQPPNQAPVQGQ